MEGLGIALITTAIVAASTVISAAITTYGSIKTTKDSNAKELLRDDLDRTRSELERSKHELQITQQNLIYALRQVIAYHQLEDVYFDKLKEQNPKLTNTDKAPYRRLAQESCGSYPSMSRNQGLSWIELIEGGQTINIQPTVQPQND